MLTRTLLSNKMMEFVKSVGTLILGTSGNGQTKIRGRNTLRYLLMCFVVHGGDT